MKRMSGLLGWCVLALALAFRPVAWGADVPATLPASELPATQITLHLKDALAEDIFDAIGRQGGTRFAAQSDLWDRDDLQRPVSIDLEKVSFWEAVREACDKTGLSVQSNYYSGPSSRRYVIVQGGKGSLWGKGPMVTAGPFVVVANQLMGNRTVDAAGSEKNRNERCSVQMTVYTEPKTEVSSYNGGLKITEAVDENGLSLMPESQGRAFSAMSDGRRASTWNLQAHLNWPVQAGRKLVRLKGIAEVLVVVESEKWEIPDVLAAKESTKTIGRYTLTFKGIKPRNDTGGGATGFEVDVVCKMEASRDEMMRDSQSPYNLLSTAQLADTTGQVFNSNGANNRANSAYYISYYRLGPPKGKAPEPAKWSVVVPVETRLVAIPVEFKDLPLP